VCPLLAKRAGQGENGEGQSENEDESNATNG